MNSNKILRRNITYDKLKTCIKDRVSQFLQKYIFGKTLAHGGQIYVFSLVILGLFSIWVFFHLILMNHRTAVKRETNYRFSLSLPHAFVINTSKINAENSPLPIAIDQTKLEQGTISF